MPSRLCVSLLIAGICGPVVADDKLPPAVGRPAALTPEQTHRGEVIRKLLVAGIDYSRDFGQWPKELPELNIQGTPPLIYLGPPAKIEAADAMERNLLGRLKAITPVCHESFETHPDGVWVGFADAHLEFVRDEATLKTAISQGEPGRQLIEKLFAATSANAAVDIAANAPPRGGPPATTAKLILKFRDEAGQPLTGVEVGHFYSGGDYEIPGGRSRLFLRPGDTDLASKSDAAGHLEIQYSWFFNDVDPANPVMPLIAMQKERGLIAMEGLKPADFTAANADERPAREIKLRPGIRVAGSLSRVGAPWAAGETPHTAAYVHMHAGGRLRPMLYMSTKPSFEFLLPPGEYLLHPYGSGVYNTFRYLKLDEGANVAPLHIDLPPDVMASLVGKKAPELQQIKGWKNGKPTTLEKLRGKWVLLDFWGYWCGPCIQAMPELMKLHDEFGDKGLTIVAVHDDSVASIEEMDNNIEQHKKEHWAGRDLPFLIALDGGGELPISGTERRSRGATHAVYGIQGWPTTVLIDPQGNVVRGQPLRPLLERELNRAK
jgi:thiol-disulfide isomerase/thioredoxin